jgi:hypothetical protein
MRGAKILIGSRTLTVIAAALGLVLVVWAGTTIAGGSSPDDVIGEPVAMSAERVVASGTTPDGESWQVLAYESDHGICLELRGGSSSNISSGGCGFGVPEEHEIGLVVGKDLNADRSFVYGVTSANVSAINIQVKGDTPIDASVVHVEDPSLDGYGFFAEVVPSADYVGVDGLSNTGAILESV